eukprot:6089837-Amphidinium_carterae.1
MLKPDIDHWWLLSEGGPWRLDHNKAVSVSPPMVVCCSFWFMPGDESVPCAKDEGSCRCNNDSCEILRANRSSPAQDLLAASDAIRIDLEPKFELKIAWPFSQLQA